MLARVRRFLEAKPADSKLSSKQNPTGKKSRWELIGTKAYGEVDFERVPPWVQKQIARIYRDGTSSLGLHTYELKGKTYRYKLAFAGQGGPLLNVYRRKRRKASLPQVQESACSVPNQDEAKRP